MKKQRERWVFFDPGVKAGCRFIRGSLYLAASRQGLEKVSKKALSRGPERAEDFSRCKRKPGASENRSGDTLRNPL